MKNKSYIFLTNVFIYFSCNFFQCYFSFYQKQLHKYNSGVVLFSPTENLALSFLFCTHNSSAAVVTVLEEEQRPSLDHRKKGKPKESLLWASAPIATNRLQKNHFDKSSSSTTKSRKAKGCHLTIFFKYSFRNVINLLDYLFKKSYLALVLEVRSTTIKIYIGLQIYKPRIISVSII